jgi:hypothetical protein
MINQTVLRNIILLFSIVYCHFGWTQNIYKLNEPITPHQIHQGHLKLGGSSPGGGKMEVNSFYVTENGQPIIPVTGEFHFSRYPENEWEQSILKIKSGGVTVIPTYVFWNMHEEYENQFRWDGNLNLRKFVELCHQHDMRVIVRIGPFCHGEIRNGGLPDWMLAKPMEVRSNDEKYLYYVKRLYNEIGKQLNGLYYKDGGPIIGIQIENEHQHSAAPWAINYPGEAKDNTCATYDKEFALVGVSIQNKEIATARIGEEHMLTLKRLAEEAGMIAPLYTATGWGNAAIIGNEAIPVTAAYTYPFWEKPSMSPFCLFKDIQHNPDYSPVRYNTDLYPSFCAEMGVGIQMIYESRPVIDPRAAEALMVRTLGSGANCIGYYMYHGGSNPRRAGGGFYADEPMGIPKISYDYQAPIGEFGLASESYKYLRLIHTFIRNFGKELAPMRTVLPEGYDSISPSNRETLRFAARMKNGSGFLFMTNFQDHDINRHKQEGLKIELNLKNELLTIPEKGTFTLEKDASIILPFNMNLNGARLKYATAQLLAHIQEKGDSHYIFFAPDGIAPEYVFDQKTVKGRKTNFHPTTGTKSTFELKTIKGNRILITTLTRQEAIETTQLEDGRLIITSATVVQDKNRTTLLSLGKNTVDYIIYPSENGWKKQQASVEATSPQVKWERIGGRHLCVKPNMTNLPHINDYFLNIKYTGDVAMAFIENDLVLDHFWHGKPWCISMKRFTERLKQSKEMNFYFRPLAKDAPFIEMGGIPQEMLPDFSQEDHILEISNVELIPEYRIDIDE